VDSDQPLLPIWCWICLAVPVATALLCGLVGGIREIISKSRAAKTSDVEKLKSEGKLNELVNIASREFDANYPQAIFTQIAAAQALYESGGIEALGPVIDSLSNWSGRVRLPAAMTLMTVEETRAQAMQALVKDTHPIERDMMDAPKSPAWSEWLAVILRSKKEGTYVASNDLRVAAVEVLGQILEELEKHEKHPYAPTAKAMVYDALDDENKEVWMAALRIVKGSVDRRTFRALLELLKCSDADKRFQVVNALEILFRRSEDLEAVVEALSHALNDSDERVANAAAQTLAKIDAEISCWICGRESGDMIPVMYSILELAGAMTRSDGTFARAARERKGPWTSYVCLECLTKEQKPLENERVVLKRLLGRKIKPGPYKLTVVRPGLWPFPDDEITFTDVWELDRVGKRRRIGGAPEASE
jgi:HEAT repeat protein